jgi:DNA-directed RNA polymerase specialized sigma subunit
MTSVDHFRKFIEEMDAKKKFNESRDLRSQKQLYTDIFQSEREFREILFENGLAPIVYKTLISAVIADKKNTLSCRVYFRERQDSFKKKIAPAIDKLIKKDDPKTFRIIRVNYPFCAWVLENMSDQLPNRIVVKLTSLLVKIEEARRILCENNLPLAVNKAMSFYRKVKNYHMDKIDFLQACAEGMLIAIDHYVPPYSNVWRSTAITRMLERMMNDHNATVLKMSPREKRILYRSKNATQKEKLVDPEQITSYVRESFKNATTKEINEIRAASDAFSLDFTIANKDEEAGPTLGSIAASGQDLYQDVEKKLLYEAIYDNLDILTLVERKVVRLRFGLL